MTTLAQDAPRRNDSRSNTDDVESILIAEWPLSRGEIARVAIRSFKGTWLIDGVVPGNVEIGGAALLALSR